MIDIPIGKALIAVEVDSDAHNECEFFFDDDVCELCALRFLERKDGKNMIFKLVDWPGEEGHEGN